MPVLSPVVCFDVGGTLIDDPFDAIIVSDVFRARLRDLFARYALSERIDAFVKEWQQTNAALDFSFASHFVQEETWIQRALGAVEISSDVLPLISAQALCLYREALPGCVRTQTHLPVLRGTLEWLQAQGIAVHVASNDRAFATPALTRWAGIDGLVDKVFISEVLSKTYPGAEKPNEEFYRAVLRELGIPEAAYGSVIYVGDSENNDVEPALRIGLNVIRYFNPTAMRSKVWLDNIDVTKASYHYHDPHELNNVLTNLLGDIGKKRSYP